MSARARAALLLLFAAVAAAGNPDPRVIEISAQKFAFAPDEVHLKAGRPVVFALRSLDRAHGFSIPDFGVRCDIPAHGTARLEWVPPRAGRFAFECDVFCGSGHEGMNGAIVVE